MKMKLLIILIVGVLIGAGAVYFLGPMTSPAAEKSADPAGQLYSCGMHPEVISDKPGNCPICGMKLTPIRNTADTASGEKAKGKILYWRAPMDPTEIYDAPGKSKMGMDLVPFYEGDESGGAGSISINPIVQQNMNLRTAPVETRNMSRTIRSFGEVTYAQDRQYTINAKISGWVEKLYVDTEGQKVRKGQPLLEIFSPDLIATQEEYLTALKNSRELASSPYASIRESAEKMVALAAKRLAYWDIDAEQIRSIEARGEVLRTVTLKSGFNGIVTHKGVKEGDKIGPGMILFHIADISRIWIEASVYESEISLIRKGQEADLILDHGPNLPLKGKVDFIYPYLDGKSRTNAIRLVFDNTGLELKPEMYVTVLIHAGEEKAVLAIPGEAVIHTGRRSLVFVRQDEGAFELREIRTGLETDDGYIQVLSGLFPNERVVSSGQFLLDSESRTREAIAKMRSAAGAGEEMSAAPGSSGEMEQSHQSDKAAMGEEQTHEHTEAESSEGKVTLNPDLLYVCPMHPGFVTTDPKAVCPECGMNVVKLKDFEGKVDLSALEFYTCPMHPDFFTTDPDGRCPECGMTLEKVKK